MNEKVIQGFAFGISQVQIRYKKEIEEKIKDVLNVNSSAAYHNYRTGRQKLKTDQALQIQEIFKQYGINQPWGSAQ